MPENEELLKGPFGINVSELAKKEIMSYKNKTGQPEVIMRIDRLAAKLSFLHKFAERLSPEDVDAIMRNIFPVKTLNKYTKEEQQTFIAALMIVDIDLQDMLKDLAVAKAALLSP